MRLSIIAGAMAILVAGSPAAAQDIIGSYVAFIGRADLFNSSGRRLDAPWQVLRQDRANVHRFGISQPGDEWDPFFGSIDNRAAMELMLRRGSIDPDAARAIMTGGALIFVRIYGRGNRGDYLLVMVSR